MLNQQVVRIGVLLVSIFLALIHDVKADTASLKNKVILITGGSKGIGAEIVKQALEQDAYVILQYNSNSPSQIGEFSPDRVLTIQSDFMKIEAPSKLWHTALQWKGHIDVLINNAGILEYTNPADNLEDWQNTWHRTLQVNLVAVADLCKEAINYFKHNKKSGVIVNVSSRAAFRGYGPDGMAYAASKAGVVALTRSIARAYARDHIFSYTVAPGITETDMVTTFKNKYGDKVLEKAREDMPTNDFATPQEVARAILFLSTGDMKHSTGMTFDIVGAADFH
ncbi:SDR family NAD(P)-dependent oxidoreductase [Candidatus Nucleicultrix amoebiphila]|jgi:NAD(P)-dependent dehydrogenase (short-subunit alcohol dehydrogenase family)|uniref:SDR family NAD(P)-dependent oxidoreductase n=1 Tax=Candidatus Nucleicultrix amoebiphila TaxID=1509244 RepID=UPI000A26D7A2|nr:SDR family oxidoreductase [Candidatus Nucleicultrix amoebiphila]